MQTHPGSLHLDNEFMTIATGNSVSLRESGEPNGAALLELLDGAASPDACLTICDGMSESERRSVASEVLKRFKALEQRPWLENGLGHAVPNPRLESAQVAVLATANLSEWRKLSHWAQPKDEHVLRILRARRPDWIDRYVMTLLQRTGYWQYWRLIRAMVREGLCASPSAARYFTGMITGLALSHNEGGVLVELRRDPDLLRNEVWHLFEDAGEADNTLANVDRFFASDWRGAFVTLADEGCIPRPRLLDATLGALELGWNRYRSKWFMDLCDALRPTSEELVQRSRSLLHLLRSHTPTIAKWSLEHVRRIWTAVDGGVGETIDAVTSLLHAREKGTAIAALTLLDEIAKCHPSARDDAALAATQALGHAKRDVQEAAWCLVEKYGRREQADVTRSLLDAEVRHAGIRGKLRDWLSETEGMLISPPQIAEGVVAKDPGDTMRVDMRQEYARLLRYDELMANLKAGIPEIPEVVFDGTDVPRLDPTRRITPITDLDGLLEMCAQVVEDDTQVDQVERVLDGLSRLADQRPTNFDAIVKPLLRRVEKRLSHGLVPFAGQSVAADICAAVYGWVSGTVWATSVRRRSGGYTLRCQSSLPMRQECVEYFPCSIQAFLSQRAFEIADRIARRHTTPLLSAPTHSGGWIDPMDLARRVNAYAGEASETDVVLAMLRMAPERKCDALSHLDDRDVREMTSAVRYALGGPAPREFPTNPLWIAAFRSREPWSDLPESHRANQRGPDAATSARYQVGCETQTYGHGEEVYSFSYPVVTVTPSSTPEETSRIPTCALHHNPTTPYDGIGYGREPGMIRWASTVWPIARESYFAMGCRELGRNVDWNEAAWHVRSYMEPLLDDATPLRQIGLQLLLIGLAAKEPGESGLAVDIAIQAMRDGRLGTSNLGDSLASSLSAKWLKLSRWAKSFRSVTEVSPLHAHITLHAWQRALGASDLPLPRGAGDVLELMLEVGEQLQCGIIHQPCRVVLERLKGKTKAARYAKQLLQLPVDGLDVHEPLSAALQARRERADVWMRR